LPDPPSLGNLVKFTERGAGAFWVAGDRASNEKARRDTGIGVPLASMESSLSLEHADGFMTRRFGGTALGLAISTKPIPG
jgi:hypothetical protein